ncbi:MAG: DUF1592 domain-containing protein [Pirellulales bacterium]
MTNSFLFQCVGCGKSYQASQTDIGRVIQCDHCSVQLTVPSPVYEKTAPAPTATHQKTRRRVPRNKSSWVSSLLLICIIVVASIPLSIFLLTSEQQPETIALVTQDTKTIPENKSIVVAATEPEIIAQPVSLVEPVEPLIPEASPAMLPTKIISEQESIYVSTVFPLLESHCINCHGPAKQESELQLDKLDPEMMDEHSIEAWQEVVDRMSIGEMPPVDSAQPTAEQRQLVINWLYVKLKTARENLPGNFGHVVLRRLNRAEYANTIRELLGIEIDTNKASFPEDSEAFGFDTIGNELVVSPALLEKYLSVAQQITQQAIVTNGSSPTASHLRIFGEEPESKYQNYAQDILQPLASRAFRRPVDPKKLDRLVNLVLLKMDKGKSFEEGIQLAIQAILCSPQFIYMIEEPGHLDDYALATRLSYFLWSSMPDDELLRLAHLGKLSEPGQLERQALRMLEDPRANSFTERFVGQWLGTREVGVMQPDKELFPAYDKDLENAMRLETKLFFAEILNNNLSALNFIDSDFTMLNERLAKHYRITGVRGPDFQRVSLTPKHHRGGVLTHASVLSITSDGVRSSPVVRGVWILDTLLGSPPPPPPANVPDIEPDTRGAKTIREELAKHRTISSCNTCHQKIDPLGFALENYDPVGRWRVTYKNIQKGTKGSRVIRVPIDASGEMPSGEHFSNCEDLKQMLMDRKQEFIRCLTEKLMTYAIGRGINYEDQQDVDLLVNQTVENDSKLRDLIVSIIQSPPFQTK